VLRRDGNQPAARAAGKLSAGDAFVDTVRIARDFGTVSELLPDGFDDLRDVPHVFFEALRTAVLILSFDELPKDERPPKRIWLDGEKLTDWFKTVEKRREEKYGSSNGKSSPGPIEDPVQNEAAKGLLVG
jgi:hypothetical protein